MFQTVLLFLFCTCSTLCAEHKLAICAIFQNEAEWLKEWLEFHYLQGVEHVYLYNNNSTDDYKQVLDPYIEEGCVTLTDWLYTYDEMAHKEWIAIQTGAYMDCIKRFGDKTNWLACIDVDEFLFCPTGDQLPDFLKSFEKYPGVAVNWLKFGTSGVEDIPPNKLLIECLTRCLVHSHRENRYFKSIVQPKDVLECPQAHYFTYKDGKCAVGADKKKVKHNTMRKSPISLNHIRINHYVTRTVRHFRDVKIPSRQKRRERYTPEFQLGLAERLNEYNDRSILFNVLPLRKQMGMESD